MFGSATKMELEGSLFYRQRIEQLRRKNSEGEGEKVETIGLFHVLENNE